MSRNSISAAEIFAAIVVVASFLALALWSLAWLDAATERMTCERVYDEGVRE